MSHLPDKPILCLDFDGVIHSYTSGWKGAAVIPDPPVPGALEALRGYMRHFTVCIHSSRFNISSRKELTASIAAETGADTHTSLGMAMVDIMLAVRDWLVANGIEPEEIKEGADHAGYQDGVINLCQTKPPAIVTIDDRGVTFTGTFPSPAEIKAFRPWNKKPNPDAGAH